MSDELLDEFSLWIAKEEYFLSYVKGTWVKDLYNKPLQMSELYKLFLKSKQKPK